MIVPIWVGVVSKQRNKVHIQILIINYYVELHMPALQFIRAIADCDQKYYPETLNKFFLVNAPGAFVYVWKIVKAWLDPGVSSFFLKRKK